MPAFDLEVYDIADLWLDMPLAEKAGAEQLPHDLFKPAVRWHAQKQAIYPQQGKPWALLPCKD